MRKLVVFFWNILLSTSLYASPPTFTYQGRIVSADGHPLEHQNVAFEFSILSPDGSCILYRELRNGVDMRNSKGLFDTPIGSGNKYFPTSPTVTLLDVFNNTTSLPCEGGATYAPLVDHGRVLRVQFYDGASWRLISPDNIIRSVPFSAYASSATTATKLGIYQAADFVLKTAVNGGTSCNSGSFLTWDSVSKTFGCASGSAGSGTVTSVTSANSYLSVANQTTTPVLTLNVGTAANTVAAGNDARFSDARTPTGAAAGDLGGNYPAPSVEKIKGIGIDFAVAPTNGQVLTFDGTNWISQNLPAASSGTVTSVTAGPGLTGGAITSFGTIGLGTELAAINALSSTGYIQRTGAGAYGTTLGSVAASNNNLVLRDGSGVSGFYGVGINGTSSGVVTLRAPSITSSYSLTFPNSQGGANQVMANNGSGILTWASVPTAPGAACSAGNVISYNGTAFVCVPDQTGASGSGITTFNGASGSSQSLDIGVTGNAPAWSTASDVHTLNIPLASAAGTVTAGLISNAEYQFFSDKQPALGYTPLNQASNLSDVADAALARANLALGTAATKNVAASGDAAIAEVVVGNDSRLTNSRAPSGAASGDLSASYPNPTVAKINGISLLYTSIASGQYLKYNGTNWINSTISTSDVSGLPSNYVAKSQIASCTTKQTLGYVSVSDIWSCQDIAIDDTQVTYASRPQKTFLAAPTGSAGAPAFRTIASTDLPSSVADGLWTASSGNVYRSTGNVGVGTIAPNASYKMHVDSTSGASGIFLTRSATDQYETSIWPNWIQINGKGVTNSFTGLSLLDDGQKWDIVKHNDGDLRIIDATNGYTTYLTVEKATGKVGIGTTTPLYPLTVNGSMEIYSESSWPIYYSTSYSAPSYAPHFLAMVARGGDKASPAFTQSGDPMANFEARSVGVSSPVSGAAMRMLATENHSATAMGTELRFRTVPNTTKSGVDRMTITHDGLVGIGTTAPARDLTIVRNANSTTGIHVSNSDSGTLARSNVTVIGEASSIEMFATSTTYSGAYGALPTADAAVIRTHSNSTYRPTNMFIGTGNTDPLHLITDDTPRITIAATGGVGIGTTSPAARLHVAGNAQIDGDVILPGNTAMKGSNTTSYLALYSGTGGSDGSNIVMYGGDHASQQGNMLVTYGGGPAGFFQLRYNNGAANTNIMRANAAGDIGIGTTGPTARLHVFESAAGAVVAKFQSGTGTCSVTPNTGMACSSDLRLKEDIKPIPYALGKVKKVNGVTFKWKDRAPADESRHMGFIAQEIEQVAPELVMEDTNGYKQVNYANFVAVLTEAFKEFLAIWEKDSDELHRKYENLKTEKDREIAQVKKELLAERKRNDELAKRLESIETAIQKK